MIKSAFVISVFLIDHAWTYEVNYARSQLKAVPGLADRMALLMGVTSKSHNKGAFSGGHEGGRGEGRLTLLSDSVLNKCFIMFPIPRWCHIKVPLTLQLAFFW